MIDDLDKSLERLLAVALPASIAAQAAITFAAPDDQFPPSTVTLPAIDLFLYDIRENTDLRSNEWRLVRQSNGAATKQAPPVRVDCSYMITAWAGTASPTRPQDEHRLLSEVMKVLLAHTTLPAAVLQGALQGQEPPLPSSSLQPGRLQSVAEFWQALGGKPKAALNYTVTIGVEAAAPIDTGPLVTDKQLRFHSGTGAP
jgi:hypothetical protein